MFFLQACIDADFLYVGLRVYHLKAKLDTAPSRFSFISFTLSVSSSLEMRNTIKRDMIELVSAKVGRRTGYKADGSFLKVCGIGTCVYIYEHKSQHAQCSQTHFSQIGCSIIIKETRGELEKCADELDHYSLLPFFSDNEEVLKDYKHLSAPPDHGIKSDIVELQEIVDGKKGNNNTPFECSGHIVYNWSENDWTKRLVTGLRKMLPDHDVTYTAEWGTQWDKNLLTRLGVKEIGAANYFLFRGSPDIVIGNKHLANLGITSNDSSSEDELIENSHQRPPMQGASIFELPEKVGEVFVGLHILLVSKKNSKRQGY